MTISGSAINVLICDLGGLRFDADGKPDHSELRRHVEESGCTFHEGPLDVNAGGEGIRFFYCPELNTPAQLVAEAGDGRYHAVIAAATAVPADTVFSLGGVRIGAGTGNMQSRSWGGAAGAGGTAPLMNTPGINSRATAQMVLKAVLRFAPDLPFDTLHDLSVSGAFDTGRDLPRFPTAKLEGKKFAVIGYGNIGREVARLAQAFGMHVTVHARERHRVWIEAQGFEYATTPADAARDADVISVHVGLGAPDTAAPGRYANSDFVSSDILEALAWGGIVVNFDRGEVVDTAALDSALASGRVGFAAIDADIFTTGDGGVISGPLAPYLPLAQKYPGRLLLLPHAAADTDHPSRVAGARQAVDQILDVIRHRQVANLKGDLPEGYSLAPERSVKGISAITPGSLATTAPERLHLLSETAAAMAAFWTELASAADEETRRRISREKGEQFLLASDRHASLLCASGFYGPFQDDAGR